MQGALNSSLEKNVLRLHNCFAPAQLFCACTIGEAISQLLDRNPAEARFAVRVSHGLRARLSAYPTEEAAGAIEIVHEFKAEARD